MKHIQYNGEMFQFPDDVKDEEVKTFINKYDLQKASSLQQTIDPTTAIPYHGGSDIPPDESNSEKIARKITNKSPNPITTRLISSLVPGIDFIPTNKQEALNQLPMVGAIGGSFAGGAGAYPGAALGSITKQLLQDKSNMTPEETGTDIAKDVGINAFLPAAVSKLPFLGKLVGKLAGRNNPAIEDYINQGLNKYAPATEDLTSLANKNLESSGLGRQFVKQQLSEPEKVLDSLDNVRKWKMAVGEQLVSDTAIKKVTSAGYDGVKFDPDKTLKELYKNGDIYKEAISPEARETYTNFLEKVKKLQPAEEQGLIPNIIKYSKKRLVFDALAAIGGGHMGGIPGAATSVLLSETALSKIASSPMLGRLAIQALETPSGTPQAQLISKALLYGMRGTSVMLQMSDGTKEKAEVDINGNLTTPHPSGIPTLMHKAAESYVVR
jgi:hypothetical protein